MLLSLKTEKWSPGHIDGLVFTLARFVSPYDAECSKLSAVFAAKQKLKDALGDIYDDAMADIRAAAAGNEGAAKRVADREAKENEGKTPEEIARASYDLDWVLNKVLVKSWNAVDEDGGPVDFHVRHLDRRTLDALRDKAWAAMVSEIPPEELEGNSS